MRESRDPGNRKQQQDPHDHGKTEANSACSLLLMCREFSGQDRDENDVVDAEDEFENC